MILCYVKIWRSLVAFFLCGISQHMTCHTFNLKQKKLYTLLHPQEREQKKSVELYVNFSQDPNIFTFRNLNAVRLWLEEFDMRSLKKILDPACHMLEWQNIRRSGGRRCLCSARASLQVLARWTRWGSTVSMMVHPLSYSQMEKCRKLISSVFL